MKAKKITSIAEAENELYWLDTPRASYCDCGHWDGCVECNPAEQDPAVKKEIKRLKAILAKTKKEPKKAKTSHEIAKSIRKKMPPPTKVDRDRTKYRRKDYKRKGLSNE